MTLFTSKRLFPETLNYCLRVSWYSVGRDTGKPNKFRWKRHQYRANVGIRHQLQAMLDGEDGEVKGPNVELEMKRLNLKLKDLDIDENNHDNVILNRDETYMKDFKEKEWRRKCTIHNILKRKYFREPPEPCFLTFAAKEQLRYLRETDSETWSFEKLAESFPITVSGVKKLLRNKNYLPNSEEAIIKHDKTVLENWKLLKSGQGGPIATSIKQKLLTGNLNFAAMNGHANLPMPTEDWKNKHLQATSITSPTVAVGEFEYIVKKYKDLEVSKAAKKGDQALLVKSRQRLAEEKYQEEVDHTAELTHKLNKEKGRLQVTFEQFQDSLKHQLDKSATLGDSEKFQNWMKKLNPEKNMKEVPHEVYEEPPHVLDVFEGKMEIRKISDAPEVTWDSPRGATSDDEKEAYIYDSIKGYQRPYGRYVKQEQIKIPSDKRNLDAIYQKGDAFYDENGEFLYRVPYLTSNKDE
ncbi:hypothetical protein CHUAL_009035 [Chamberlinius hualienensis]